MLMFVFIREDYGYICHKLEIVDFKDEYGEMLELNAKNESKIGLHVHFTLESTLLRYVNIKWIFMKTFYLSYLI